jgi:hypothetical protein
VVHAFKSLWQYLLDKPFDLYTDNASLLPAAATAASALEAPECVRLRVRVLYEMTTGIELVITCAAEYPAFCPIGIKAGSVCRELCVFCNPLPPSLSVKSALQESIDQEDVLGLNQLLALHAYLVSTTSTEQESVLQQVMFLMEHDNMFRLPNQYLQNRGVCVDKVNSICILCTSCPINFYKHRRVYWHHRH